MRNAISIAREVAAPHDIIESPRAMSVSLGTDAASAVASTEETLSQLERSAKELEKLRRDYRSETLGAVANGTLTADAAMIRVDTLRSLRGLAYHAWRSAAHLVGRGE